MEDLAKAYVSRDLMFIKMRHGVKSYFVRNSLHIVVTFVLDNKSDNIRAYGIEHEPESFYMLILI